MENVDYSFLDEDKLNNAILNKQVTVFHDMPLPKIAWEDVLQFVNDHPEKRTGKKLLASPYSFFHNEAQIITKVNNFVKHLHSKFYASSLEEKVVTCQLFGIIKIDSEIEQNIHRHQDLENNLFWQGKGKTRWRFYKTSESDRPFIDIILEENDLVYVPGGTYHYVESITPRFGFAILFGDRI